MVKFVSGKAGFEQERIEEFQGKGLGGEARKGVRDAPLHVEINSCNSYAELISPR